MQPLPNGTLDPDLAKDVIAKHGSQKDKDRFAAGLMPAADIVALARDWLFSEFEASGLYCWRHIILQHRKSPPCKVPPIVGVCDANTGSDDPVIAKGLNEREWVGYEKLLLAGRYTAEKYAVTPILQPRIHLVRCPECGSRRRGASCHITIKWGGVTMSREYDLAP